MDLEEAILGCTSEKGDTNSWKIRKIANRSDTEYNDIINITMQRLLSHPSAVVMSKCLELLRICTEFGSDEFAREIDLKIDRIKGFLDYESGVQQRYKREVLNQKVRQACNRCLTSIRKRNEDIRMQKREKEEFEELSKDIEQPTGMLKRLKRNKKNYAAPSKGMVNVNKIGRVSEKPPKYTSEKYMTRDESSRITAIGVTKEMFSRAGRGAVFIGSTASGATKKIFKRDPYKKGEHIIDQENSREIVINEDGLIINQKNLEEGKFADSTGVAEKQIVDDFTKVGGVRVNPLKEEIMKFLERCDNVKPKKISEFLNEKLKADNWTEQYRSLIGIKALLEAENSLVMEYFQNNKTFVGRLRYVEQTPVSKNAKEVMRMISGMNMFENMEFTEEVEENNFNLIGDVDKVDDEHEKQKKPKKKEMTLDDFFD